MEMIMPSTRKIAPTPASLKETSHAVTVVPTLAPRRTAKIAVQGNSTGIDQRNGEGGDGAVRLYQRGGDDTDDVERWFLKYSIQHAPVNAP